MATAEAPVEATQEKKRRRSRRDNFLEEVGVKTLTSVPAIPDVYDPARHTILKEEHFDDNLNFFEWEVARHQYLAGEAQKRVDQLKAVPEEARRDYAQTMAAKDAFASHLKKLKKSGVEIDMSDFIAELTAGLTS